MAADKHQPSIRKGKPETPGAQAGTDKPAWTDGLRELYDNVLEEPLPDSFKDLLDKLDSPSANGRS